MRSTNVCGQLVLYVCAFALFVTVPILLIIASSSDAPPTGEAHAVALNVNIGILEIANITDHSGLATVIHIIRRVFLERRIAFPAQWPHPHAGNASTGRLNVTLTASFKQIGDAEEYKSRINSALPEIRRRLSLVPSFQNLDVTAHTIGPPPPPPSPDIDGNAFALIESVLVQPSKCFWLPLQSNISVGGLGEGVAVPLSEQLEVRDDQSFSDLYFFFQATWDLAEAGISNFWSRSIAAAARFQCLSIALRSILFFSGDLGFGRGRVF